MDAKRLTQVAVELKRLANVETRHHLRDTAGVDAELAGCDPIEVKDLAEEIQQVAARLAHIEALDKLHETIRHREADAVRRLNQLLQEDFSVRADLYELKDFRVGKRAS